MILSGKEIERNIKNQNWASNRNAEDLKFGPNSVDVTLNNYYLVPKNIISDIEDFYIDLEEVDSKDLFDVVEKDNFILYPNKLVLASVNERFDCLSPVFIDNVDYKFVQHYEGRSTLGRMGIQSHVTAGFGDYGFKGAFTLELINNSPWPILLKKGMRVGQVYFESILGETEIYDGYDQTDCKPQYPRLGKNRFT